MRQWYLIRCLRIRQLGVLCVYTRESVETKKKKYIQNSRLLSLDGHIGAGVHKHNKTHKVRPK